MAKRNKTLLYVSIVIALLIVFLVGVKLTQYKVEIRYINTEDGIVKLEIQPMRFIDRMLNILNPVQQAAFSKTDVNTGEQISIEDTVPVSYNSKKVSSVNFLIYEGAVKRQIIRMIKYDFNKGLPQRLTTTWTPTFQGTYYAFTELTLCDVTGNNCNTPVVYYDGIKANYVVVKDPQVAPTCTKKPYWSGWTTYKTTPNGNIQQRVYNEISSSCAYTESNVDRRIVCDSGFITSDSANSVASYSGQTCVAEKTDVVEDTNTVIPECTADVVEQCQDKSNIVIKSCSSGILISTGNKCTIINNDQINNTLLEGTKLANETAGVGTDSKVVDNNPTRIVVAAILVVIVLLIVIIYRISRR